MPLSKIADVYPNYRQDIFGGTDITSFDVYAGETSDKIGSVDNILIDESGRFRYLVVDTGFWVFGKKVLLPIGRCRTDYDHKRVYALGLTSKDQAERLPEYNENTVLDYDYEERVRQNYRSPQASATTYNRDSYRYDHDRDLYQTNEQNHGALKLYEERLIAEKDRRKTGEVSIGKHVETQTARASIPVEKERVVVERSTPGNAGRPVAPGEATFNDAGVTRMEVYEEEARIGKQAFVSEEVNVHKQVDRDTVEAQETIRREELDVNVDGNPNVRNR